MYQLVIANNIELQGYEVKAEYDDLAQAVHALYTEAAMAASEHGIEHRFWQFADLTHMHAVAIDFGSWSDFVGLIGVSMADLEPAA